MIEEALEEKVHFDQPEDFLHAVYSHLFVPDANNTRNFCKLRRNDRDLSKASKIVTAAMESHPVGAKHASHRIRCDWRKSQDTEE